jgi:pilus assembly protein CpaE
MNPPDTSPIGTPGIAGDVDAASLVTFLGDLGPSVTATSLLATKSFTHKIEVKDYEWSSDYAADTAEIAMELLAAAPVVVCLGNDIPVNTALGITEELLARAPTTEVILVGNPAPAAWAQASRAGVREIVDPAQGAEELAIAIDAAVGRVVRLREHVAVRADDEPRARVIVILSPKGGSGKTSVAVNVAASLAQSAPERVVLVDFDCQFGDVATMLGLEPERTLTELGSVTRLESGSIKLFLTRAIDGKLFTLPSSGTPEEADLIDEELAGRILRTLMSEFDYVVVDTAAGIDERSLAAMNAATDLLFIASMDVTSVRNLLKELALLDRLGLGDTARHFVVNRAEPQSGLRVADIVAAVGMPALAEVKANPLMVKRANEGQAVVVSDPKSDVAKTFQVLAEHFLDVSTQPKKSKLFGRR